MRTPPIAVWVVLAFSTSCGDDSSREGDARPDSRTSDAGGDATSGTPEAGVRICTQTSECADLLAVDALPACAQLVCSGITRRCTIAAIDGDADGHGMPCELPTVAGVELSRGDDCDDANPRRFPGATERCDMVDDDCDLSTAGDLDGDGDGEPSSTCCNLDDAALFGTGEVICGSDCDDADPGVHARDVVDGPTENCNGVDDDCDGETDLGCGCVGDQPCGPADVSTEPPSRCQIGVQRCVDGRLMSCEGAVYPRPETCEIERFDDDCDGVANEVDTCMCDDGQTRFFGGATDGVHNDAPARCRRGREACVGGTWMISEADVGPAVEELCDEDNVDDDCDGARNEGCSCTSGMERPCGGSPLGFNSPPSVCVAGTQRCDAGAWGACVGAIDPGLEVCDDGMQDENCDNRQNEDCECTPGLPVGCGGGAVNVPPSRCVLGSRMCVGGRLGTCVGSIEPAAEVCNGLDDDCDGSLNEEPEASASCAAMGAIASCVTGSCAITGCASGRGDCDADPTTGCEADITTSPLHCGGCMRPCDPGEMCVDGICDPVLQVTGGGSHTCALRQGGRVMCWGYNNLGQIGDGTVDPRATPVFVTGLSDAVLISAGDSHTCAIRAGGQVVCWGSHADGQLGHIAGGPGMYSSTPVAVVGVSDASVIAAGGRHSCAVRAGGSVWCWGANGFGQLGRGTMSSRELPGATSSFGTALEVTTGTYHSCARTAAPSIYCWGSNDFGQIGDGTGGLGVRNLSPTVLSISSPQQVSAYQSITCARTPGGVVVCWGAGGAVGDGTSFQRLSPVLIAISDAAALESPCVIRAGATARCWGFNDQGQIGDGTTIDRLSPVAVSGLSGVRNLGAGQLHACGVTLTGEVWCWGDNFRGQLGDGSGIDQPSPVRVVGFP